MYGAIDVGGTKTLVALFHDDGELVTQVKFPTPPLYNLFLDELHDVFKKVKKPEVRCVGIALPGKIDRKHGIGVAFGNLPWSKVPIVEDVEAIFKTPVVLENDARLAALSEAILLKNQFSKVLYTTISTGIGGGLIIDGRIDPDFEDMEIGQILLEHDGKLMRWEEFGSGKAFYRKYNSRVGDMDPKNTAAWYWFARNIAVGLIDLIATLTPEVIVIGGGAGSHLDKFKDRLDEQLKIYENPLLTIPPIVKAQRPEEAVIYGCYELAKQKSQANVAIA
jgi:predicted NBD/HSP70 family sugar kinase